MAFPPDKRFITALIVLLFILSSSLIGESLYFEKRDFSNLTIPSVSCIAQDNRGYIWVGTPGGLLRYDSRKPILINKKNFPVLPSDQILSLGFVIDTEELWIGTSGGMVRYSLQTNKMERVQLRYRTSEKISSAVVSIAVRDSKRVFAVSGNSIVRYNGDDNMEEIPVDPAISGRNIDVYEVAFDADGNLWATASDGLKRWDENISRFKHAQTLENAFSLDAIGNNLWIGLGAGEGLIRYRSESGIIEFFEVPGDTTAVASDPDGLIWVGTENDGIYIINPGSGNITSCDYDPEHPYKLPSKRIESLFPGRNGRLWIGTADTGLISVDNNKSNHLSYIRRSGTNGLPSGSFQAIFEDSLGYIWVGSNLGGVARIDPITGSVHQYRNNPMDQFSIMSDHISGIVEDDTGRLWIGTDKGPALYLPEVDGFEPAGNMISGWPDFRGQKVIALVRGLDGSIWISFMNGSLYRLNLQEREYKVYNFPSSTVPAVLFIDEKGTLWAGSGKNLRLFNSKGELIRTWQATGIENEGIQQGGITEIFSDSRGQIWLGGPSGLSMFKGFNKGIELVAVPSLPLINVSGISEDDGGFIWVADGRQIHIFNPDTEYITTMGSEAGFTPSGFVSDLFITRSGTMYVGANNEIWNYNSFVISPRSITPEVYLEELSIMNKVIASGYSLDGMGSKTLNSDEKVFSISFEAVDYRYLGTIDFQYQMQGVSDLWVDNGSNDSVTFANLSPGNYLFSVRAVNNLGDISRKEASISLKVERSYWQRTPALIMYIIVAGVLMVLFLQFWKGHLMKAQITELEEARKKIIEANKKLAFLTMNDSLTGLLNRRGFDKGISHALGTAQRNSLMITMFMMDVDFFKLYNDNYGHVRGDDVLRGMGKALSLVFGRSTDIIARYGGEEFAVVFVGENPNASVTLANDLGLAIEELGIPHEFSSVSPLLTLSVGSVTIKAEEVESVESFIQRADEALYAAKEGGRNRVCYTGIIPELPLLMKSGLKPLVLTGG